MYFTVIALSFMSFNVDSVVGQKEHLAYEKSSPDSLLKSPCQPVWVPWL